VWRKPNGEAELAKRPAINNNKKKQRQMATTNDSITTTTTTQQQRQLVRIYDKGDTGLPARCPEYF
jgi:hypothetical protein